MANIVKEIEQGPCPLINRNSAKAFNDRNRILYVYGGVRWPDDDNDRSPTRLPTAGFYSFNLYSSFGPLWSVSTVEYQPNYSHICWFYSHILTYFLFNRAKCDSTHQISAPFKTHSLEKMIVGQSSTNSVLYPCFKIRSQPLFMMTPPQNILIC